MKIDKLVSIKWDHARLFDAWSFVHALWGLILGTVFSIFGWSFTVSFLVALSLMILWEVFEYIIKIIESFSNVFSDIFVGIVGFLVAFLLIPPSQSLQIAILSILVIAVLILEYIGWSAFKKKKSDY